MNKKEKPAKILIILLCIVMCALLSLLVYKIATYEKPIDYVVTDESVTNKPDPAEEPLSGGSAEESELTEDELIDLIENYDESVDEEGALELLTVEEGKVTPAEHYCLYNISDYYDGMIMYSNISDYMWSEEIDWYALLYIDEEAENNVTMFNEDEITGDILTSEVEIFGKEVTVYVYPYADSIVAQAAILPNVALEVTSDYTTDVNMGLENFKYALDIEILE